jgi:hypothetical protein
MLKRDVKEAKVCFENDAYKATMVLCGSILENILLDRLSVDSYVAEQGYLQTMGRRVPSSLERWSLDEMLRVSGFLGLVSQETYQLCDLLRNYRNLIHPAVSRRTLLKANRTRAQRALEAARQALQDLDSNFALAWQNAYIINITGVPSCFVGNANTLQTAVANILRQHGLTVHSISSFAHMNALLQNPPAYTIVANTHGEIMPVGPGTNWRDCYRSMGEAVKNAGWIFVNIGGYPFYYEAHNHPVGEDGLNAFLSTSDITANCMNATNADFTERGRSVIRSLNMRGLPHAIPAIRCARWQHASQKMVFLGSGNLYGVSAIRMGRGWFVHIGLESAFGNPTPTPQQLITGDNILGNFGIGSALYVADRL